MSKDPQYFNFTPITPPKTYSSYGQTDIGQYQTTSKYDIGIPYGQDPNIFREERQSKMSSLGNMIADGSIRAIAAIDDTIGSLGDWQGIYNRITSQEDNYSNWLNDASQTLRQWSAEKFPEYHSQQFGDFGWWMQNGRSVIETAGYAAVGGVIGEGIGIAAEATGIAGRALQLTKGIGTAITMNYAEGVQTAGEVYRNLIDQGVNTEIASKEASKMIDLNRINIIFDIPEYLALFKVKNTDFSRAFQNIEKKSFANILGEFGKQAFNEGSEEVLQGFMQSELERNGRLQQAHIILNDPGSSRSQKEKAKKTIESLNPNSNGYSRFFNYITSDEGITSGLFGALGGIVFQGAAELKGYIESKDPGQIQRETEAKDRIEQNTSAIHELLNKNAELDKELEKAINDNDEINRDFFLNQKFANLAYKNAKSGTYKQFLNTLENISNATEEEAKEFGLDYEFLKKKAPKFLEDAKLIESMYNDVQRNFSNTKINTNDPIDHASLSQLKNQALEIKYNYKLFDDFRKQAVNKREELYAKHTNAEDRLITERLHELEAIKQLSKENKEIKESIDKNKTIEFLQNEIKSFIDLYNQGKAKKKGANDFINPIIDEEAINTYKKEYLYDHLKDKSIEQYKDLVKRKQEAFEDTKKQLKEKLKEEEEKEQVQKETEKKTKEKQEEQIKAQEAKPKPSTETIKEQKKQEKINKNIPLDEEESIVEQIDFTGETSQDLINRLAKENQATEESLPTEESGEDSYNPMPEEYEKQVEDEEDTINEQENEAEIPNAASSVFSLAYNLIDYSQSKSGRYKSTGEVDPNADTRLFNPNFIKEGEELVVFIDQKYKDYDTTKDDVNEVPIGVVKKEDFDKGEYKPFAYIHRTNWYKNNNNIKEELRDILAEETKAFRNKIFQNRGQNNEVIPYTIKIVDKSIGRLNLTKEQYSIFEVEQDPQIVVAKNTIEYTGNTREFSELVNKALIKGVPYILINTPNNKAFAKYLKTYKLKETRTGEEIATTIQELLEEYYKTKGASQKLTDVKIKDFRDLKDEIKKYVYFGDKTVDLDLRKQFYANEKGIVTIQGRQFNLVEEYDKNAFKSLIKDLYITVNSRHIDPKNNAKFSHIIAKNNIFTRQYIPYKHFLDQNGFITINAKSNYGTIFGNYVTKIDSSSLKPYDQPVVEEKQEQKQEGIVAKEEEKPYIEEVKKPKKHGFKRATKSDNISDEEARKRKDDCK